MPAMRLRNLVNTLEGSVWKYRESRTSHCSAESSVHSVGKAIDVSVNEYISIAHPIPSYNAAAAPVYLV